MEDARVAVGDLFEKKVEDLFELSLPEKKDRKKVPDLESKDHSFYVEVKASSYTNGGVINERQLLKFGKDINTRRFYALVFHSLKNMQKDYQTKGALVEALDLRSLFLFPLSVVKAYFDCSNKRVNPRHDTFVQLVESRARAIFKGDQEVWGDLGINYDDYSATRPHEKIHILTKGGQLEREILSTLHLEFL